MAGWQFITGITGLLGQYLLIDALRRRESVAVLVRGRGGASASERVDRILTQWESRFGILLERPVVLQGDLRTNRLGLSDEDSSWFRGNVTSVLHSAASVRFSATKSGEPMKSNLEGTRYLLDLCCDSSVREFHYVSTAYSCGQVKNPIVVREELHSPNGPFGNVYEESKCLAEHLLVQYPGTFTRTIYRPSVIVGESTDGYAPSFNAIYTPLRLAWTLLRESPAHVHSANELHKTLGLSGNELRNLVPVDWVCQAISSIVRSPKHHGGIYHITNPHLTTGDEITTAMVQSLTDSGPDFSDSSAQERIAHQDCENGARGNLADFRRHMQSYRSYFVSDPTFDNSKFRAAATCESCPTMGTETLTRAFSFAVRNRFRSSDSVEACSIESEPRCSLELIATKQEARVEKSAEEAFDDRGKTHKPSNDEAVTPIKLILTLSGTGGGCWKISTDLRGVRCDRPTRHSDEEIEVYCSANTFRAWLNGEFAFDDALRRGAILITGAGIVPERIRQGMQELRSCMLAVNDRQANEPKPQRWEIPKQVLAMGSESC